MKVITPQDLRQHIFDLWGKADGIEWADAGFDAVANHDTGTIRIHPITSEAAYAIALHEIGHLRRGIHEDEVVNERWAWEWARANALVWTPTMAREAERLLGHYEADFAGEAHLKDYYYKQILAFVSDLLYGGRPAGWRSATHSFVTRLSLPSCTRAIGKMRAGRCSGSSTNILPRCDDR
jgi:hypothetical protein